jgi:ankyrin repeat protein
VRLLIEEEADIDEVLNCYHNTALIGSAACGRLEIVRILLEAGARTDLKNMNQMTALDFSIEMGHDAISDLLK